MEIHFSRREGIACTILSHLQYEKDKPAEEAEFLQNRFNNTLIWICTKILKVNVIELFKKVSDKINNPNAKIVYD